jgi:hypothetical protein
MYRLHASNTNARRPAAVRFAWGLEVMQAIRRKATEIGGPFASARTRALIDLRLAYLHFRLGTFDKAAESLSAVFETDSSLGENVGSLDQWMNPAHMESDFRLWALEQLSSIVDHSVVRKLAGLQYAKEAYIQFHAGNFSQARKMALRCLTNSPSQGDRKSMLYILASSIVGSGVLEHTRTLIGHKRA